MKTTNLPGPSNSPPIPTGKLQAGFSPLNTMLTGGLPMGRLWTIGAFNSSSEARWCCKSNIIMALAQKAIAEGKKVLFLSPEIVYDTEHQTDFNEKLRNLGISVDEAHNEA